MSEQIVHDFTWKNKGRLKIMIGCGTRPEIIRLNEVIKKCDKYFDLTLVHTGQNYDYELNQVFFDDLGLRAPDYYLNVVGADLGETVGNVIANSYKLMCQIKPDAVLFLGKCGGLKKVNNLGDYLLTRSELKNLDGKYQRKAIVEYLESSINKILPEENEYSF